MGVKIFQHNTRTGDFEEIFPNRKCQSVDQETQSKLRFAGVDYKASYVSSHRPFYSVANLRRGGYFQVYDAGPSRIHKLAEAIAEENPDAVVIVR